MSRPTSSSTTPCIQAWDRLGRGETTRRSLVSSPRSALVRTGEPAPARLDPAYSPILEDSIHSDPSSPKTRRICYREKQADQRDPTWVVALCYELLRKPAGGKKNTMGCGSDLYVVVHCLVARVRPRQEKVFPLLNSQGALHV